MLITFILSALIDKLLQILRSVNAISSCIEMSNGCGYIYKYTHICFLILPLFQKLAHFFSSTVLQIKILYMRHLYTKAFCCQRLKSLKPYMDRAKLFGRSPFPENIYPSSRSDRVDTFQVPSQKCCHIVGSWKHAFSMAAPLYRKLSP